MRLSSLTIASPSVVRHEYAITGAMRAMRLRQHPCVLWFTGLSGAGKSTISEIVESELFARGFLTYVLDGDNVRHGLCRDLGFSDSDRIENIRRIGEVSKLFVDAGVIVLTAFISPFRSDRQLVRRLIGEKRFVEVYVDAPFEICEARDPKGLYRQARLGLVRNFTGIDSPYEEPEAPELILDTSGSTPNACARKVIGYLEEMGWIPKSSANPGDFGSTLKCERLDR